MFGGKEPAIFFNGIGEIVRAAIPVLILAGVISWDDKTIAAIMLFVGVFLGFLTTMFTRSQTVTTVTANQQIETAIKMPSNATVEDVIAVNKEENK